MQYDTFVVFELKMSWSTSSIVRKGDANHLHVFSYAVQDLLLLGFCKYIMFKPDDVVIKANACSL